MRLQHLFVALLVGSLGISGPLAAFAGTPMAEASPVGAASANHYICVESACAASPHPDDKVKELEEFADWCADQCADHVGDYVWQIVDHCKENCEEAVHELYHEVTDPVWDTVDNVWELVYILKGCVEDPSCPNI